MQRRKQFIIGITFLLLLCIFTGCGSTKKKENPAKKIDYYIGVVDDNAPYYYKDSSGTEKGSYVTFLNKLSKEQSFTYAFVPIETSSLDLALSEQSIDGFIGSIAIKTGEEKRFNTTEVQESNLCVISPKTEGLHNLKDLADKTIVASAGAGEEVFARYLANKYKGQAIAFSSIKEAQKDVEAGYSQALIIDKDYYNAHADTFKSWNCLKESKRFQNKHEFYKDSK